MYWNRSNLTFRPKIDRSLGKENPLNVVKREPNTTESDIVHVFCTSCWETHRHGGSRVGTHPGKYYLAERAAHCLDFPGYGGYGYNYSGYYFFEEQLPSPELSPPKKLKFHSRMRGACYDSRTLDYMTETEIRDPHESLMPGTWSLKRKPVCRTRYCGDDLLGVEFIKTDINLFAAVGIFEEDSHEMKTVSNYETIHSSNEYNKIIKTIGMPDYLRDLNTDSARFREFLKEMAENAKPPRY